MTANAPVNVSAADARNNFAEIIGRARFGGETFLIEKQGKPFAVVIGIEQYQQYQRLLQSSSTVDGQEPSAEHESDGPAGPPG